MNETDLTANNVSVNINGVKIFVGCINIYFMKNVCCSLINMYIICKELTH